MKKSIESNDYNYVKKILNIKPFKYKCMNYDEILIKAIEGLNDSNNGRKKISKLLIDSFVYNSNTNNNNNSEDTLTNTPYEQQYFNLILNILIKKQNLETIKYLIESEEYKTNLDVNAKDINGECPLINALYQENNEMIKYLIEHGGNCNIKNNHGIPLLVLAIQIQNYEIVNYILEKPNIHINEKCKGGYSAFMTAINQNNTDLVESILNYATDNNILININVKDANGNYPIAKAFNKKNFDMVILLMEYGMDNNIDINGNSLLSLAYKQNNKKIFKYLIEYLDVNQLDNNGQSVIFNAADKNDINTVNYLIHCGANLNIRDKYHNSIIDYAIFSSKYKLVDILLQNDNLLLNEYNSEGETPLISLIKSNLLTNTDKKIQIPRLINCGGSIEKPDKKYILPPITHAVKNNNLAVTKLLIKFGVNINKKNAKGHSHIRYGVNYSLGNYNN